MSLAADHEYHPHADLVIDDAASKHRHGNGTTRIRASSRAGSVSSKYQQQNNNNNNNRKKKQRWNAEKEAFAKKCCIQFSPPFRSVRTVTKDVAVHRDFITQYSHEYGEVIARVLVWRIVAAAEEGSAPTDLFGAWSLLVYVFGLSELTPENISASDYSPQALQWDLIRELETLMLPLVGAYWHAGDSADAGDDLAYFEELLANSTNDSDNNGKYVSSTLEDMKRRLFLRYERQQKHRPLHPTASSGNVSSNSNGGANTDEEVSTAFKQLEIRWLSMMRKDYAENFRQKFFHVRTRGNTPADKTAEKHIQPPPRFFEYLAIMRLDYPRPSHIHEVQTTYYAFDRRFKGATANKDLKGADDAAADHHALLAPSSAQQHPRFMAWIRKLDSEDHCMKCDTWKHSTAHCPCIIGVQLLAPRKPGPGAPPGARPRQPQTMSYGDAIAKLAQYDIHLPPLDNGAVLDLVTKMIMSEQPYDAVLEAFDVVRGYRTGVMERHALWLHAGYNVMPSKTALADDSDNISSCMLKIRTYMEKAHRTGEYLRFEDAVDLLNDVFKRKRLSAYLMDDLAVFTRAAAAATAAAAASNPKNRHYNSMTDIPTEYNDVVPGFFFAFLEPPFCDEFPVKEFGRGDIDRVAPFAGYLCRNCLEPFHKAECCPTRKQSWDLFVAQSVLSFYNLVGLRTDEFEANRGAAYDRIMQDPSFTDAQRTSRMNEFNMACSIIQQGGPGGKAVPFCNRCRIFDHSQRSCEVDLSDTLHRFNWSETLIRLNPSLVERAIEAEERKFESMKADAASAEQAEPREPLSLKKLKDIRYTYCHVSKRYPPRYADAVELFKRHNLQLHAARYSPEAFSRLVIASGRADIQSAFEVVCEPNFPDVCCYCGAVEHESTSCREHARSEEIKFINELTTQHQTALSAFSIALLCVHRLPARLPSLGAQPGSVGGRGTSSQRVVAGPALLPTAFPEGRASLVNYFRRRLEDPYAPGGPVLAKAEALRNALEILRRFNISVGVCKFNEPRAKQFARDLCYDLQLQKRSGGGEDGLRQVLDAIKLVAQDPGIDVCLVCGETNGHITKDCRAFYRDPMNQLLERIDYHQSVQRYCQKDVFDVMNGYTPLAHHDPSRYSDLQDSIYKKWEYDYTRAGIEDFKLENERRLSANRKRPRDDWEGTTDPSSANGVTYGVTDSELPTVDDA